MRMPLLQAQPMLVSEPFTVQPSDKPLTAASTPLLAGRTRAAARQQFDEEMARKEQAAQVIVQS